MYIYTHNLLIIEKNENILITIVFLYEVENINER